MTATALEIRPEALGHDESATQPTHTNSENISSDHPTYAGMMAQVALANRVVDPHQADVAADEAYDGVVDLWIHHTVDDHPIHGESLADLRLRLRQLPRTALETGQTYQYLAANGRLNGQCHAAGP